MQLNCVFKKIKEILNPDTNKQIFLYLLRVFIFLILNRTSAYNISFCVASSMFSIIFKNNSFLSLGLCAIFSFVLYMYLTQKLCGLFKKLDKLNFFISLAIIFLIEIARCYSMAVAVQFKPVKLTFEEPIFLFVLPFLYLIYKFFNFLSKKFPIPFQKIGYYTSIEFWKKFVLKK